MEVGHTHVNYEAAREGLGTRLFIMLLAAKNDKGTVFGSFSLLESIGQHGTMLTLIEKVGYSMNASVCE